MRNLRLTLRRLLLASATVVTIATGAGVGATAATAGVAATAKTPSCTWQSMALKNGWHSEQSAWGTGDPAYCAADGIVYLSGSLAQSGNGNPVFAVLPAAERPASDLFFSVPTFRGQSGVVSINPSGRITAQSGQASEFTSLAGISYPARTATKAAHLIKPLVNGWESGQPSNGTGNPAYLVRDGAVYLTGSVIRPAGTPLATSPKRIFGRLPKPVLPSCFGANVYTFAGGTDALLIDGGNGNIYGNDGLFTSLAGLSYPLAPVHWHTLPQLDGNDPSAICPGPSYAIRNGVVNLTGELVLTSGSTFAVLPPAARPTHTLYLDVEGDGTTTFVSSQPQIYTLLTISPDGAMHSYKTTTDDFYYLSLSGMSFRLGS